MLCRISAFRRKMLLLSSECSLMTKIEFISESSVYMDQFAGRHNTEDGSVLTHL